MNIRFRPLFTLAVGHPYYAAGCRDFDFHIPHATGLALQAGRTIARQRDGALHVLFEADEGNVPVSTLAGKTLYFGLRLRNPYFGNFTAPVLADPALTPLYANRSTTTALDAATPVHLAAGFYEHAPQLAIRPVTLNLLDSQDHIQTSQILASSDSSASFDLRGLPEGIWTITEAYGPGVNRQRALLLNPELRDAGVWGALGITVDAGFYATPATLTVNFAARQETLKYFVVAANFGAAEFNQLNVVDAGFTDEARPQVIFDKVQPANFTPGDIAPALLGGADKRIVLFQSQAPVTRRERGFKKLHLQRNNNILIEHLPQPSADRPQAHLIIHLSKP